MASVKFLFPCFVSEVTRESLGRGIKQEQEQLFQTSLPGRQVYLKTHREATGQADLHLNGLDEEGIGSLLRTDLRLTEGRHVHAHLVSLGLEHDVFLANLLIRMYGKCGEIDDASSLFSRLHCRDLISWNTMLSAFTKEDKEVEALRFLGQLKLDNLEPDAVSYLTILKACSSWASLADGEKTHVLIVDGGFESSLMMATALVDMYGRCGSLCQAKIAFNKILVVDVAAWNAMIGAHNQSGLLEEALRLFIQMQEDGITPNKVTYVHALSACASVDNLEIGELIHTCIVENSLESNTVLSNALVTMYGKCGNLENAYTVFKKLEQRTVVSWTAIITECSRQGCNWEALDLFYQMQEEGMQPARVTFITALCACAGLEALAEGKAIHILVTHKGFESDVFIGTALINMYGKCNHVMDAHYAFINISQHNVVSWNAMIAAYAQQGHSNEALEVFRQMQQKGVKPDKVTFVSVLTACALTRSLDEGRCIHYSIVDHGLDLDVVLQNALVDMYGKCAALELAQSTFDNMDERNVITWTTLISAYAQQGHGKIALKLYKRMQEEGGNPNKATFLSLLSACSHAGLVDEGFFYFASMTNDYVIEPEYEHYGIMVDLYGRAGLLKEAEDFIGKMPFEADACIWSALLGACQMHGDISRGKHAAENIFRLQAHDDASQILL